MKIWPTIREFHRLPRFWVVNITATVGGAQFEAWVKEAIAERNEGLAEKRHLFVEMDP